MERERREDEQERPQQQQQQQQRNELARLEETIRQESARISSKGAAMARLVSR
jgi:hypothetical protein